MNLGYAIHQITVASPGARGRLFELEAKRALRNRQLQAAVSNPKGWPWQRRTAWRRNSGGYDAGSIEVKKDATSVTGTSTTFPDPCAGWLLAMAGPDTESYRVQSRTSSTVLVLDRPYEGESGSGKAYKMYDPYVQAPNDLWAWEAVTVEADGRRLGYQTMDQVRGRWPKEVTFGEGWIATMAEPTADAEYETGDVTVAKGSAAVTGNGTTFPDWSAGHHFRLAGEDALYRIKQKDSATALTLDRVYGGGNAGSAKSYQIDPPGAIQLELHFPHEDQFAVKIDYLRFPQELVNDTDEIEGDVAYAAALVDLATSDMLLSGIDYDQMTEQMVQEIINRARVYMERGNGILKAMLIGEAPIPVGEAALQDCRYRPSMAPVPFRYIADG